MASPLTGAVQDATIEGNVISAKQRVRLRLQITVAVSNTHYHIRSNNIGTNSGRSAPAALPNGNHGTWITAQPRWSTRVGPGNVVRHLGKSGLRVEADGVAGGGKTRWHEWGGHGGHKQRRRHLQHPGTCHRRNERHHTGRALAAGLQPAFSGGARLLYALRVWCRGTTSGADRHRADRARQRGEV